MTYSEPPDLVVVFGFRAFLSLFGMAIFMLGFWLMERQWDDQGSTVYENARQNAIAGDYHAPDDEAEASGPSPDAEQQPTITSDPLSLESLPTLYDSIPLEQLEAAFPRAKIMLVGTGMWALSFFFSPDGGFGMYLYIWNFLAAFLLIIIGFIYVHQMRTATTRRMLNRKKMTAIVLTFFFLAFGIAVFNDYRTDARWYYSVMGVLFIVASYPTMWRIRRMGATWDLEGKPNPNIVVQNAGCWLFLVGLFFLWIGMNGVSNAYYNYMYLSIYKNSREWLAFVSGVFIIVPSYFAMEYAFDQGSESLGYWLDGRTFEGLSKRFPMILPQPFASSLESPMVYLIGWFLFSLSSFLPFGSAFSFQQLFAFFFAMLAAAVDCFLVLPSFWAGNKLTFQKWSLLHYGLMVFLIITIGFNGRAALILSMLGILFIWNGRHMSLSDRKRGSTWLEDREENRDATSFGLGQPIFILGWIMLSVSMALPM